MYVLYILLYDTFYGIVGDYHRITSSCSSRTYRAYKAHSNINMSKICYQLDKL